MSKFCYEDLFRKQSKLVKRLLAKYINIAKLYLPVKELINPKVYQYLYYYIKAKENNYDKTIHELKKPPSILIPLKNLIDSAFNIVNNSLKET